MLFRSLKNELSVDLAGKVKTIVIVGDKLIEAPIIITAKADRKIVVLIILFIIVLIIAIIRYIIYKIRLWKQLRRIELMEEQKRRLDAQEKELERKHNILMRIAQRLKHHVTRQKDIKDDVEMKKSRIRAFIHRIKTHMDRLKKK